MLIQTNLKRYQRQIVLTRMKCTNIPIKYILFFKLTLMVEVLTSNFAQTFEMDKINGAVRSVTNERAEGE